MKELLLLNYTKQYFYNIYHRRSELVVLYNIGFKNFCYRAGHGVGIFIEFSLYDNNRKPYSSDQFKKIIKRIKKWVQLGNHTAVFMPGCVNPTIVIAVVSSLIARRIVIPQTQRRS